MPRFPNGQVPRELQVVFATGTNGDGYFEHRLPPSAYQKVQALIAFGIRHYGRVLRLTAGWSCDRPISAQIIARRIYGNGAAVVGTSSHGGCWAGPVTGWRLVDTAAMDWSNWLYVFGSRANFYAACRAVGLIPGAIAPPAFPDEPWHTIDLNPWAPIPAAGPSKPIDTEKDDDMFTDGDRAVLASLVADRAAAGGVQYYERVNAGPQEWMIVDPTFAPLEADPKQDGYRITLDPVLARVWGRQYSGSDKVPVHVSRDDYIATQEWARARAAEHRAAQVAIVREALKSAS